MRSYFIAASTGTHPSSIARRQSQPLPRLRPAFRSSCGSESCPSAAGSPTTNDPANSAVPRQPARSRRATYRRPNNLLRMENPWLHRYTVLVAAGTALLFINGPVVSTSEERPLYSLGQTHAWSGLMVTILMAVLVVWMSRVKEPPWLRRLAWAALAAAIVEGSVALETGPLPAPVRIAHTALGLLLFSTTMVTAVVTSHRWNQMAKPIEDGSRARSLATTTAALVLLQVTLGAAFRHGVTG